MLKLVLFAALVANVIFTVSATETKKFSSSSASVSSSSSSSSSRSSSSSGSSTSTSSSSSQSSSLSSASSNSTYSNCNNTNKEGKCTKPNEVYEICPLKCPFRTCGIDDRLIDCMPPPQVGDPECPPPACRCKPGFFRDDKGNCVEWENCPVCTNPNEEYDPCPAPCPPRRCDVDDRLIRCKAPPQVGDPDCKPGCRCADNFARNDKGICVPRDECPQNQCKGANEEYVKCPDCSPQTCDSIGKIYHCPLENESNCKGSCRCKSGYYRNIIGECITEEECMMCNRTHEYFTCGGVCDNVCATLQQQNQTNCPIKNIQCNRKCYCEEGYARDGDNNCIPIEDCKEEPCKEHEVYVDCPNPCSPKKCSQVGFPIESCPNHSDISLSCTTKPACVCEGGYYRNNDGVCIPSEDCPSCGGDPNARPGCGNCRETCANYNSTDPIMCIQICYENACDCLPGYVVDSNTGKCVLPENCTPICGKDEVYTSCINGGCDKKNCSQLSKPTLCIDPIKCLGGCTCRKGYLRAQNGTCVPLDQCELAPICGKDEVYTSCVNGGCDKKNCSQLTELTLCIDPIKCLGGCICRKGYLRAQNGTCVPLDQCDPGCPAGEVASKCPPVGCNSEYCPTSNNYTSYCPTPEICGQPKCVCEYGKRRDRKTGRCISNTDCPPFPCFGGNETYYDCPSTCPGENCLDYLHNSTCSDIKILVRVPCQPHCRCDEGYYRNSSGYCVDRGQCTECPEDEFFTKCPPMQCDAEYCPLSRNEPLTCSGSKECKRPRCLCGFNSHRDRLTGKCIATYNCPPFPCEGPNEEYQSCPPVCPGQNCSDYINNSTCPNIGKIGIVVPCKPQCRCINNTYRNTDGVCVPADQCILEATSTPTTPDTSSCNNIDGELNNFELGNTEFTGKFFYEVAKSNPDVSIIMSAFSVLTPLAELALYASGPSLEELLKVLNLQNKDQIRCVFPKVISKLEVQQNNTLNLGANVFVNEDFPLTDNFIKDTKNVFNAEAENIDVNNPDKAATTINDWAAEQTNNRITDLISPDTITSLTRLILANAIYFKGTWKTQFDPKNTKNQDFSITKDDIIQVKTMKVKDKFNYAESTDLDAKIIELPYVDDVVRFIGILPNDVEGLSTLLEKLQDPNVFNKAINSLSLETVTVLLPAMDISTTIDLTDILPKTNITKIFDADTSGLSGIIKSNEPLYVSDGTQKATIIVNEEGSEAAAANVVGVSTYSATSNPVPEYIFNVNHPVAYYILFDKIPLFCGTFVKP